MDLSMLAGPAIGAVIGYCTNYIAVKMLFRPLYPVKIGTYTLPFTPGIIPKGKERLAKALGNAVGNTLLTEDDIKEAMVSEKVLDYLDEMIEKIYEENEETETIEKYLLGYTDELTYHQHKLKLIDKITVILSEEVNKLPIAQWVQEKGTEAVMGQLDGFLALMVSGDMIRSIAGPAGEKLETYIREEGYDLLWPVVKEKISTFEKGAPGTVLESLGLEKEIVKRGVKTLYCEFVDKQMHSVLQKIDIGKIVENKIGEMPVEEIEVLVLSIMKKELGAVVNLGAVIGFLIGIVNVFI